MTDPNTQLNQGDNQNHDVSHVIMMPNIEENEPLPKTAKDAMPEMSMEEELKVRVETIKTIADLKGEAIPDASPTEQQKAVDFVKKVMTDPNFKPEYGNYTDPTMAFCAGMVAQTQVLLAKDLADFKLYVVNGLVKMAETAKSDKDKIAALKSIGEVDGVDAFKKKTEVTHKVETMEEVEKELLSMLSELKSKGLIKEKEVIDARHMYIAVMRIIFRHPVTEIGRMVDRDHTTILDSMKKFKSRYKNYKVEKMVEKITINTMGL